LISAAGAAPAQEPAKGPAEVVAQRAFDIQAGPAWEKARYFAFTFNLDRDGKRIATFPQRWDRTTGQYRVSGLDPQGKKFEVAMNVNTKQGKAWVEGAEVKGEKLAEALAAGYRRYQNDTFWLLMPLKMLDPGVRRIATGSRDDACGHTWDLVRLTFEPNVGFGPNDIYWAWINRDTGLVDYWDMKLTMTQVDEPPVTVTFRDYRRIGGLLISTRREIAAKKQMVRLDELQVLPEAPKGAFELALTAP
jgi:hypothetical protein